MTLTLLLRYVKLSHHRKNPITHVYYFDIGTRVLNNYKQGQPLHGSEVLDTLGTKRTYKKHTDRRLDRQEKERKTINLH